MPNPLKPEKKLIGKRLAQFLDEGGWRKTDDIADPSFQVFRHSDGRALVVSRYMQPQVGHVCTETALQRCAS